MIVSDTMATALLEGTLNIVVMNGRVSITESRDLSRRRLLALRSLKKYVRFMVVIKLTAGTWLSPESSDFN